MSLTMTPSQACIALLGLLAIYLTTDTVRSKQRWGPVLGLLSQPFWLMDTYTAGQGGMFFLSCVYCLMWVRGVWNFWELNTWWGPLRAPRQTCALPAITSAGVHLVLRNGSFVAQVEGVDGFVHVLVPYEVAEFVYVRGWVRIR